MATYHGINQATCINCGRVTLETLALEILNDSDATCIACGFHFVAWLTTGGTVITWEDSEGETHRHQLTTEKEENK